MQPPPFDAQRTAHPAHPAWRGGSGAMFDTIARRYDLLNRLSSFGLDRLWRRRLVKSLQLVGAAAGQEVLDVATGTADVALATLRRHPAVRVLGLDPSAKMLELAANKGQVLGLTSRLSLLQGDVQALPMASHRFAASCISFGIRNVPDRLAGLREMVRVTQPGGRVCVLELGEPRGPLGMLARFHVHHVVPALGRLLSGRGAYTYLAQSIAAFPPPAEFAAMMQQAGLVRVQVHPQAFGAAHLYVGEVAA